ncbi:leucyl aminopeptidase [Candidatus Micrarchaeota archaeon]|nr:leucyl aminopeptidase [Candidatus Micrarchaeota archaeon]MBD3417725.1 leucyl aminopeptidase [Candidatus Micrarchaeota archaeon]
MKVEFEKKAIEDVSADAVVLPCMKKRVPSWVLEELKEAGVEDDFDGSKETAYLLPVPKKPYKRIMLIGIGDEKKGKLEDFRLAGGRAQKAASKGGLKSCALWINEQMDLPTGKAVQAFVEGFLLRGLKLDIYKTEEKNEKKEVEKLVVVSEEDFSRFVKEAVVLAESQNYVRRLDLEPSNVLTPQKMADEALVLAKKHGMDCRVYSLGELEQKGMGGIISVGKGSAKPPVLVRMAYNEGKDLPHIALVGKAVTFDSGGISLKPGKGMASMKYDKSGALVLMGVMRALAELRAPVKATLVFGAVENMPDGNATNPGDVVKSFSGKTIEIINTDAEGRVCLADAVAYAATKKPELIMDVATLTGAANIVLGKQGICMMGTEQGVLDLFEKCGNETYERVWPLPTWEEYSDMIKSDIADVKNLGSEQGEAGTITAGMFIKEFTSGLPWVHLDIASVDLMENPNAYLPKGPSARGVRLITSFVREWAQKRGK